MTGSQLSDYSNGSQLSDSSDYSYGPSPLSQKILASKLGESQEKVIGCWPSLSSSLMKMEMTMKMHRAVRRALSVSWAPLRCQHRTLLTESYARGPLEVK